MILYLCRHAIAADSTPEMSDAERPLTKDGVRKFRQAARGFARLSPAIDQIYTSPLRRSVQTGDILRVIMSRGRESIAQATCEDLAPPGNLDKFLLELAKLPADAGAIAVGHEPILSHWVGKLCFGRTGRMDMKKGMIVAVSVTPKTGAGELLWAAPQKLLRSMA